MKIQAQLPVSPARPSLLARSLEAVDEYTSPRENTAGNLPRPSYFQAMLNGSVEGFYMMGPAGIMMGACSGATAVTANRLTRNKLVAGLLAASGGAACAAVAASLFASKLPVRAAALSGALMGTVQSFYGSGSANLRDSFGGGALTGGLFLHGPMKLAGGIASALASNRESAVEKAAVGAATGAALGIGLSALGLNRSSMLAAAMAAAAAGAIGPFFGPRFSQTFRNLAQDVGTGVSKVAERTGLIDHPLDERKRTTAGAIPAAYLREMVRGAVYTDGSFSRTLVGASVKAISLAHIMYCSREKQHLSGIPQYK